MIVVRALTKGGELDKLRDMTKCATSIYYYISKVEPFALSIRTKIKADVVTVYHMSLFLFRHRKHLNQCLTKNLRNNF